MTKKLLRITKAMKESQDVFYDEIYEMVAKNLEAVKGCETEEEMKELLQTTDKEMLRCMIVELEVYGYFGNVPQYYTKSEYINKIVGHIFYLREAEAEKQEEIQAAFHAIRDMKTGTEMREILEPKSDEIIFEMAKELDEDIKQGREELIKKIIILTLFGVLPKSERRKKC